ncbi:hypothetical protein ACFL3A_13025 [Pseudomonadota bacterium]
MKTWKKIIGITAAAWTGIAAADWTDARCDIYPRGEDKASAMIPCTFGQRQGAVTITRSDGVTHNLIPAGDGPGNFRDQDGRNVYRQSGLGDQGLIFRFPHESVYVYWNTAALVPDTPDYPTWPFTTKDYDATTLLRCRAAGDAEFGQCPAGILRMEGKQASVVVQNKAGQQFTINFMTDYVNATNGKVDAILEGGTWIITIDGEGIYEVPLAAIEGG